MSLKIERVMMSKKPIERYIPQKAEAILNSNFHILNERDLKIENIYYLLDLINRLPFYKKDILDENNGFISLSSTWLKNMVGNDYRSYLDFLIEFDILYTDNQYFVGEKSKGFKFTINSNSDLTTVYIPCNTLIYKKIIKARNKRNKENNSKVDYVKAMKEVLYKIKINYDEAYNWINDNILDQNKRNCNFIAIKSIRNKKFHFERSHVNNRIHSTLTSLKKELKNFIIGDFVSFDLKNSQPLLLSYVLFQLFSIYAINEGDAFVLENRISELSNFFGEDVINSIINNKKYQKEDFAFEVVKYFKWTFKGVFYDEFMKELNLKDRSEAKKIIYKIFFSSNLHLNKESNKKFVPYKAEKEIFKKAFPYIYNIIKQLKSSNHRNLSVFLQQLEAEIFIDKIAAELVSLKIIPFTIHDSIMVPKEHELKALEIINKNLSRYFIHPPMIDVNYIGSKI